MKIEGKAALEVVQQLSMTGIDVVEKHGGGPAHAVQALTLAALSIAELIRKPGVTREQAIDAVEGVLRKERKRAVELDILDAFSIDAKGN